MGPEQREQLDRIESAVRGNWTSDDPAHDLGHIERVVSTARHLLSGEGLSDDPEIAFPTLAACWLHDMVQTPKGTSPGGADAQASAQHATAILDSAGVLPETARIIETAIREHSFSGRASPSTLASAILQDADRVDALGSVGLARLWAVAGTRGSKLYDPDDPAALHRPIDDRRYALDHIQAKLLGLPATMSTATGRSIASERARIVLDFFHGVLCELGVDPPPTTRLQQALMAGEVQARLIFPGKPTPRLLDAARALDAEPEQILKSLLFISPAGESVLAIASGPERVASDQLATLTGLHNVELAKPDAVRHHTGYQVGAVPPVGLPGELPVIVDEGVPQLEVAFGGGGRVDALLQIPPSEIIRMNQAKVAQITER